MKTIDRYVSRQLLVNLLFAIAVLSFVLVLGNIFRRLLPLVFVYLMCFGMVAAFPSFPIRFSFGLVIASMIV